MLYSNVIVYIPYSNNSDAVYEYMYIILPLEGVLRGVPFASDPVAPDLTLPSLTLPSLTLSESLTLSGATLPSLTLLARLAVFFILDPEYHTLNAY